MSSVWYYLKKLRSISGKILYLNLIGMVIISLLEGLGILLLIPLLEVSGLLEMNTIIESNQLFSRFTSELPPSILLIIILTGFLLIMAGQHLLHRKVVIQNVKIQEKFGRQIRIDLYKSILHSNWSFFLRKKKSDLINSLTTELARVIGGVNLVLQLTSSIIFTGIQIGLAFWLSAEMTFIVVAFGLILSFFSKNFIIRSKKIGSQTSLNAQEYLSGVTDQFNGIKEVKSNLLEETHFRWIQGLTAKMSDEQINYIKLTTSSQLFYKISSACLIVIFLYVSLTFFTIQKEQLLLVILILSRLWPRFTSIQTNIEKIASTLPAFISINDLHKDCVEATEFNCEIKHDDNEQIEIMKSLSCRDIAFRYQKENPLFALKDINLSFPIYKMTAIVGPSGAGKSTLIDIIMGLNRPEKGEILIDGTPPKTGSLLALRKAISYVPQDPFLFNASIRENLQMIQPDATDEDIWEALQFSSAAEFVTNLPEGLDTLIGDRGIRLSGGERQRIVLARAILKKPSILILDEATSALDSENEAKIQKAIERLKGKMTIIVIAHRLSTIRNADQVIVLDKGRIVQSGSFNQLAQEKKSMFSNLLEKQIRAIP
ncbi:ABC transporter ATP-binding protein [Rossellomorea sp. NRS-1567]|uniref:ABC transporter ATP-binding protein n=1 Tax=Rossellomorea sp. NRS-1567 TaxID=3233901 RepID=UPI003D2AE1C3